MAGRKKPQGEDVVAALAKGPPRPLYAIDGDERMMVDEAVRALEKAAVPAHAADFNYDRINARDVPVGRIVEAAQTLPAFAERRMVLVTRAEHIDADAAQELLAYVQDPSPTTVLVLVADKKLDARTKLYKALKAAGATYRYEAPTLREMPQAIRRRAERAGIAVDEAGIRTLVSAAGTDLSAAVQALEVASLYVGPNAGRPVGADDVAEVIAVTREESIFELVDAIGRRDRAAVLAGLHRMLASDQAHPLQLLALVARHYRNLMKARAAQAEGIPKPEMGRLLGVSPWVVDKLLGQARGYDGRQLSRGLAEVAATDRALKGGRLEPRRAMERLVLRLMAP